MTSQTETMTPTSEPDADEVRTRVVLIDARPDRRAVMRQVFEHSGVDAAVVGEADGEADAIALVEQQRADLAVIELPFPVAQGLAVIAALRARFPDLAIVVISFNTDAAVKEQAVSSGADAYLVKPVSAREVVAAVPAAAG
ncbi:MAG TPA: response regulator [Acidimicrobiales bacterium]|nr:response regulator [Acidimicrobiales bacterium]